MGVHFLWAPLYSQHGDRIQRYLAHRPAGRPLIVVAGILYHNVGSTVPAGCAQGRLISRSNVATCTEQALSTGCYTIWSWVVSRCLNEHQMLGTLLLQCLPVSPNPVS